jgi:hypothetical protein
LKASWRARERNARERSSQRALLGGQPPDVLGKEIELAARAVPVRLQGVAMLELVIATGRGQQIKQTMIVIRGEYALDVAVGERSRLERASLDAADEIERGRRARAGYLGLDARAWGPPRSIETPDLLLSYMFERIDEGVGRRHPRHRLSRAGTGD